MDARRPDARLVLTLSGEIHTKSRRTSRWFRRVLKENLEAGLARGAPGARTDDDGHWLTIEGDDLDAALDVARRTLGVHRVHVAVPVDASSLDALVEGVTDLARDRVAGRTFAVRVKRSGHHDWGSPDAARRIGSALLDDSAGVDLDHPEVEIHVHVFNDAGWFMDRSVDAAGGVPLGTQDRTLALMSGGFDSPVATWMLMRRGSPVDLVHFKLDCAQSDHAAVVAHDLWRRWGHGTSPLLWLIDFQPVKDALIDRCPPRLRQVVLKQLMFRAADRLAAEQGIDALVTGESVGQVSSQTLTHLAEIDRMVSRTVLRPLAGATKLEIIDWARRIGTEALSARAKEVCDLSDGPVAVAARRSSLDGARADLPTDLVDQALASREVIALESWAPGRPYVPVVGAPGPEAAIVLPDADVPLDGPITVAGEHAAHRASALLAQGREVCLLVSGGAIRDQGHDATPERGDGQRVRTPVPRA